ncbi:MAG: hypothetical protein JXR97_12340 [Planctomycetes bacterium]|nr:hypothetical protein [Planctomycetota bacterium]
MAEKKYPRGHASPETPLMEKAEKKGGLANGIRQGWKAFNTPPVKKDKSRCEKTELGMIGERMRGAAVFLLIAWISLALGASAYNFTLANDARRAAAYSGQSQRIDLLPTASTTEWIIAASLMYGLYYGGRVLEELFPADPVAENDLD